MEEIDSILYANYFFDFFFFFEEGLVLVWLASAVRNNFGFGIGT